MKNIESFNTALFILSSPDTKVVESIISGLLKEPYFNLYKEKFVVFNIKALKQKNIKNFCTFKTLSPILVRVKRQQEDGKVVVWELYPTDKKFYENISKNLVKKYEKYYGKYLTDDHFNITDVEEFKPKSIVIGSGKRATYNRCSLMTFSVDASNELLQFAYDAGLGEKTAMGFGCLDVVQ